MPELSFNIAELDLIIEALEARAGRHESMARFSPRGAGPHDRKAEAMRKLAAKLHKRSDEAA